MRILPIVTIFIICSASAFSQVPRTISFQGVLTDASGNLVPDGNHQLAIKLYSNAVGGTPVFTENHTVPVVKGVFNAIIGSVTVLPASLLFDRAYFLGVSVNGGSELAPRTALTAVPFALRAERANVAESLVPNATGVVTSINNQSGTLTMQGGGGTTVTSNGNTFVISSVGGGGTGIQGVQSNDGTLAIQNPNGPVANLSVASNAITSDKIASGQVVKSVNGLTDNVTLAAGNNVTLTPSGNTITIASTGGSGGTGIQTLQNTNATLDIQNPNGPVTTVNVGANAISAAHISNNAVTPDKIAPNIISSINGVSNDGGEVQLVAGANVTITPNDAANTITIAASSGGGGLTLPYSATPNLGSTAFMITNSGAGPAAAFLSTATAANSAVEISNTSSNAFANAVRAVATAGNALDVTNNATNQATIKAQNQNASASAPILELHGPSNEVLTVDNGGNMSMDGHLNVGSYITTPSDLSVNDVVATGRVEGQRFVASQDNGPSNTPGMGSLYRDNIIYGWGNVSASGSLTAGMGITVSRAAAGVYNISYKRSMNGSNYSPMATLYHPSGIVLGTICISNTTSAGCTVNTLEFKDNITKDGYFVLADIPFFFHLTGRP